jgi:argininosuccinate lyase
MAGAPGYDRFPAAVYRDTVLAPLFETSKRYHAGNLFRIHYAHGVMLAEQAIIPKAEIGRFFAALREIERDFDPDALRYDERHEDLFFALEELLKERVGDEIAGKLHTARSRNDIDHTLFKLALKERMDGLAGGIHALLEALLDVAERERATLIVAYTHGQPAQPTTFGHYLAALVEILLRDCERLGVAGKALDLCSMGAAAITTSGFAIDRARVASLLGFAAPQENSYGCIAACDYVTGVYAALKVLFINLGRFIQDLNQWTGFETGQLHVPDGFVQISSIMPQKRNPVPIEHMRLMASLGAGHCDTIVNTMHNTPFTDMNDSETEAQGAGDAGFAVAGRLLSLLAEFVRAVRVNEARVRRNIDASCIAITELADSLVRSENIPFRAGHEVATLVTRLARERDCALSALPHGEIARLFASVAGREMKIGAEELQRFMTPEHFVAVRERFGGPGPKALAQGLARYRAALEELRTERAARQAHEDEARRALTALVDAQIAAA